MTRDGNSVDEQVLKIAIQTVIHRRRDELKTLLSDDHDHFLDDIAAEITRRAVRFQSIADSKVCEFHLRENT